MKAGTASQLQLAQRVLPRMAGDDFFCVRYQVWYPSHDCAVRTKYETAPGCLNCDQGRFNYRRHAASLESARFHFPEAGE